MTASSSIVRLFGRFARALSLLPLLAAFLPTRFESARPDRDPSAALPAQGVVLPQGVKRSTPAPQQQGPPSRSMPPKAATRSQGSRDRIQTASVKVRRPDLAGLRDPFRIPPPPPPPAPAAAKAAGRYQGGPRPPGIRGLYVEDLRLQGIVRQESTGVMIAMVTSDTHLAYFLREDEQLYDGVVTRITPGALYLRERLPGGGREVKWRDVVLKLDVGSAESR